MSWLAAAGLAASTWPLVFLCGWAARGRAARGRALGPGADELSEAADALIDGDSQSAAGLLADALAALGGPRAAGRREKEDKGDGALSPDAARLALVLGRLLRARGECGKAIELHERLAEDRDLPKRRRDRAVFELGMDYRAAGLLDRAETQFERLLSSHLGRPARCALYDLHQADRDWKKAINVAHELSTDSGALRIETAQLFCELGEAALLRAQFDRAREYCLAALNENPKCARALLLTGDLELKRGRFAESAQAYETVEGVDPEYLAMAARGLLAAYEGMGLPLEGLAKIVAYAERYPALDLLRQARREALRLQGPLAANELARRLARLRPGADALAALLAIDPPPSAGEEFCADWLFMRPLAERAARASGRHACKACGFCAMDFSWRCPACGRWETMAPNKAAP